MSGIFPRILVIFLVPCLLQEPLRAVAPTDGGMQTLWTPTSAGVKGEAFGVQALSARPAAETRAIFRGPRVALVHYVQRDLIKVLIQRAQSLTEGGAAPDRGLRRTGPQGPFSGFKSPHFNSPEGAEEFAQPRRETSRPNVKRVQDATLATSGGYGMQMVVEQNLIFAFTQSAFKVGWVAMAAPLMMFVVARKNLGAGWLADSRVGLEHTLQILGAGLIAVALWLRLFKSERYSFPWPTGFWSKKSSATRAAASPPVARAPAIPRRALFGRFWRSAVAGAALVYFALDPGARQAPAQTPGVPPFRAPASYGQMVGRSFQEARPAQAAPPADEERQSAEEIFKAIMRTLTEEQRQTLSQLAEARDPAYVKRLQEYAPEFSDKKIFTFKTKNGHKPGRFAVTLKVKGAAADKTPFDLDGQKKIIDESLVDDALQGLIEKNMTDQMLRMMTGGLTVLPPPELEIPARPIPALPFPMGPLGVEVESDFYIMPDAVSEALRLAGVPGIGMGGAAFEILEDFSDLSQGEYGLFLIRLRSVAPEMAQALSALPEGGRAEFNRRYFTKGRILILAGTLTKEDTLKNTIAHELVHRKIHENPADVSLLQSVYAALDNEDLRKGLTLLFGDYTPYRTAIADGSFWEELYPWYLYPTFEEEKADQLFQETIGHFFDPANFENPDMKRLVSGVKEALDRIKAEVDTETEIVLQDMKTKLPPITKPRALGLPFYNLPAVFPRHFARPQVTAAA